MINLFKLRGMHPDLALEKLREGNIRFQQDAPESPRRRADCRKKQIGNQTPFCAILACSDSRVPVEILFDQGIGDIFVVRLAGNVASLSAMESLDFAVHVLKISLIVVLGHQNCGAVDAVIHHTADVDLGEIASIIQPTTVGKESLREAIMANVQAQVDRLKTHPLLQPELREKNLKICGGYYDFESGLVTFLK